MSEKENWNKWKVFWRKKMVWEQVARVRKDVYDSLGSDLHIPEHDLVTEEEKEE
ncbi:MAG: hypothetical protein Q8M94_22755 [Ignavibacteria bacterium]|nr:hypothetical protein [Ignavibacteria bacterium]